MPDPLHDRLGPEYARDSGFAPLYRARCRCGLVRYEVRAEPLDAKLCHCRDCQVLHGAPMQWAAIFEKSDVRISAGLGSLTFFHSASNRSRRELPCKIRCRACGTPIADEGRNMWLAFPALFGFATAAEVPPAFRPTCHIFYASRAFDVHDDLPKWAGHKDRSARL